MSGEERIRIYALARVLGVDPHVVVEACPKAGVAGKGSALASLDAKEQRKVEAYFSGGSGEQDPPLSPVPSPGGPKRPPSLHTEGFKDDSAPR